MLDTRVADFLRACVRARLSIVFAGAPGSGKTTLLSCCAAELDPTLRVVDRRGGLRGRRAAAQRGQHADPAGPRTTGPRSTCAGWSPGFLRMAPDVAIVGEVRDREALPLLLTLSSGVKGFTTIHAGSARQALTRLRFICQLADTSNELPMSALNALVSEAIDLVVHCAGPGRRSGSPRSSPSRTCRRAGRDAVHRHRAVQPAHALDEPLDVDAATCPSAPPGPWPRPASTCALLLDADVDRRAVAARPRNVTGSARPAGVTADRPPGRRDAALAHRRRRRLRRVPPLHRGRASAGRASGVGPRAGRPRRAPAARPQQWLVQAGLEACGPSEFVAVMGRAVRRRRRASPSPSSAASCPPLAVGGVRRHLPGGVVPQPAPAAPAASGRRPGPG